MQLSPLQSRLAASLIASCILLLLYFLFFSPHLALAAELEYFPSKDDTENWAHGLMDVEDLTDPLDLRNADYEPDFPLLDRSIIGRATSGAQGVISDVPFQTNINPGQTNSYVFYIASVSNRAAEDATNPVELRRGLEESEDTIPDIETEDGDDDEEDVEGSIDDLKFMRRQSGAKTLWISANTCIQPGRVSKTTVTPPQLTLYVSTSNTNTSPGPGQSNSTVAAIPFVEGAVMYNISLAGDVYFSISAPNVSTDFQGIYNYEVAASTEQCYFSYDTTTDPNLIWVDSDASSTLMITQNLTNTTGQVITAPPYVMFAQNSAYDNIDGLQNSYCGLSQHAQIRELENGDSSGMLTTDMTTRGEGGFYKQQFYFSGLNASSRYVGIMAKIPPTNAQGKRDNVAGGGGIVYRQTQFDTKPSGACQVVFNLTFCDQTAYAVPGNTSNFPNASALATFYDSYASSMYDTFKKVLAQIPCETAPEAQYSLARNCSDCEVAYKDWLCTVAIPRCEDFSSTESYLQMRNINSTFANGSTVDQSILEQFGSLTAFSSSRNPIIDQQVQPGPYKEVLPCDDLCYSLVQSCPAAMQFGCPLPGGIGYQTSYGTRDGGDGNVTCNYPGSAHFINAAADRSAPLGLLLMTMAFVALFL